MLATLGALLVCAAPVKVAVPGFNVVGIEQALGDAWAEHFVTLLGRDGDFQLISAKDIAQVLGLERQKQLMGCSDGENSCLTELAGALGVDAILSGTFAKSGSSITATLRVLKAADGTQIGATTDRFKDVDALQDWLDAQVPLLAAKLRAAFKLEQRGAPAPVAAVSTSSSGGAPIVRWVPAIVGGAAVITGAVLFGLAKGNAGRLSTDSMLDAEQISQLGSSGRTFETAGAGLLIGGGVAVAVSVVWMLLAPSGEVRVAVVPGPSGVAAVVGGSF